MNYDLGTYGSIPQPKEVALEPGDTFTITFDASNQTLPNGLKNLMVSVVGRDMEVVVGEEDDIDSFAGKDYSKSFKLKGTIEIIGTPQQTVNLIINNKFGLWQVWNKLAKAKAKFTVENVGTRLFFNAIMFSGTMGNL